jgi:phage head maturation protease
MQERDAGLFVEGQLDIEDSELAREAWRSVKRGRISLSFGYLTEAEREGPDRVKELTRLDLMEITLTSVPANPDARVLSTKSASGSETESPDFESMDLDELRARSMAAIAGILKRHRPITIVSFPC